MDRGYRTGPRRGVQLDKGAPRRAGSRVRNRNLERPTAFFQLPALVRIQDFRVRHSPRQDADPGVRERAVVRVVRHLAKTIRSYGRGRRAPALRIHLQVHQVQRGGDDRIPFAQRGDALGLGPYDLAAELQDAIRYPVRSVVGCLAVDQAVHDFTRADRRRFHPLGATRTTETEIGNTRSRMSVDVVALRSGGGLLPLLAARHCKRIFVFAVRPSRKGRS